MDLEGNVLGRHGGVTNFTVGQRRGLDLGGGPPRYVVEQEAGSATVVVGEREALAREVFFAPGRALVDSPRIRRFAGAGAAPGPRRRLRRDAQRGWKRRDQAP